MTDFAEDPPRVPEASDTLTISLAAYEGPLDLLLTLARTQKIDLAAIPILPLVDQYLAFIAEARRLRLEVAADYLVMAAWLTYLKSALLLPADPEADPDPQELAARLAHRLQRLEAMRDAAAKLMARDLLGRDVAMRGNPEGLRVVRHSVHEASLYDLLSAYGALHARRATQIWSPHARGAIVTLEQALERLNGLLGTALEWTDLRRFLPDTPDPALARSSLASHVVAALELTRQGRLTLTQPTPFGPLLLRANP
ncbi:segregation and condensation protein A [Sandaracinobacteroides saxicola]|uniref:Segregation and condensation protein A n=1 Tax=Sandaracinobacteroides saxicola TaxID=2759707 RepID=A0A7G5IK38_9SPHN|nr:ScpA family protein [Sandaracinobacteroides saxicola]QMW23730.1 segregation/condensation protein A [Sandaracinobacteroides saxicola]